MLASGAEQLHKRPKWKGWRCHAVVAAVKRGAFSYYYGSLCCYLKKKKKLLYNFLRLPIAPCGPHFENRSTNLFKISFHYLMWFSLRIFVC